MMNRRHFVRSLAGIAAAGTAAPQLLAQAAATAPGFINLHGMFVVSAGDVSNALATTVQWEP